MQGPESKVQLVEKLLALSTSPNAHEAESAAAKARELIHKFSLFRHFPSSTWKKLDESADDDEADWSTENDDAFWKEDIDEEYGHTPPPEPPREERIPVDRDLPNGMWATDEQHAAADLIVNSLDRFVTLTGLAGTGKSTVLYLIVRALRAAGISTHLAAPTGKAARVVARKTQNRASTVHALLYTEVVEEDGELTFDGDSHRIRPGDVVIIDEASMVSRELHKALDERMPFGARCVYVGDPGQLPPVNDSWGPDFTSPLAHLDTIHRQAEGSAIIQAAYYTRTHGKLPPQSSADEMYMHRRMTAENFFKLAARRAKKNFKAKRAFDFVIITYRRKVRAKINEEIRQRMGLRTWVPQVGEPLRVCSNSFYHGLTNGEIVHVVATPDTNGHTPTLVVEDVDGRRYTCRTVKMGLTRGEFIEELNLHTIGIGGRFPTTDWLHLDYGYASTCHAAQGSEWTMAIVHDDDFMGWLMRTGKGDAEDQKRWYYTAVTRAAKRCVVVSTTTRVV